MKVDIGIVVLISMMMLLSGLTAGFIIGLDVNDKPVIVIDTSHEPTIDWFVRYHGLVESGCAYNYQGGFTFERKGETISLLTPGARSAYAKQAILQEEDDVQ